MGKLLDEPMRDLWRTLEALENAGLWPRHCQEIRTNPIVAEKIVATFTPPPVENCSVVFIGDNFPVKVVKPMSLAVARKALNDRGWQRPTGPLSPWTHPDQPRLYAYMIETSPAFTDF